MARGKGVATVDKIKRPCAIFLAINIIGKHVSTVLAGDVSNPFPGWAAVRQDNGANTLPDRGKGMPGVGAAVNCSGKVFVREFFSQQVTQVEIDRYMSSF